MADATPYHISHQNKSIEPSGAIVNATQSNTANITYQGKEQPTRGILLESAGAVSLETAGGDVVTFASGGLAVGIVHPIAAIKILEATDSIVIKLFF